MTVPTPRRIPPTIRAKRYVRNGQIVTAPLMSLCGLSLQHTAGYRKKVPFRFMRDLRAIPAGAAGTTTLWRTYIRTGCVTQRLTFRVSLFPADNAAAVNPRVRWQIEEIGGATVATDAFQVLQIVAPANDVPARLIRGIVEADIDAQKAYGLTLEAIDYARPVSCIVYERENTSVTVGDTGFPQGVFAAGQPIYDSAQQQLIEAGTVLWKGSATQLLSWSRDTASVVISSATPTNLLDGSSTTVSASTPGVTLDTTYHNTVGETTVPVELAVYGQANGGGTAAGAVRIAGSGGSLISVAITPTAGWHTATGTIPAGASKVDIQASVSSGTDVAIDAVCLLEYEG